MTMPEERTRSLRWTREFLEKVAVDDRLGPLFQERAKRILQTYPSAAAIKVRAAVNDDWMAPDPRSEDGSLS